MAKFRVIQGCPVNSTLAPYIQILIDDCARKGKRVNVNSLYRGEDARSILNRHGKRSQGQLYRDLPRGVANPPGQSSHELRSDGRAFSGPVGRRLQWWQQGIDLNDDEVQAFISAGRSRGWVIYRPYKSGVERHHVNFAARPKPRGPRTRAKLIYLRAKLPRR